MSTLLHRTLALAEMGVGEAVGTWVVMAAVRMWEAVRSWASDVSGPVKATMLPLGVHLAAETLTLVNLGTAESASLQMHAREKAGHLAAAASVLHSASEVWLSEMTRLGLAGVAAGLGLAAAAAYDTEGGWGVEGAFALPFPFACARAGAGAGVLAWATGAVGGGAAEAWRLGTRRGGGG